jgi:phospholipase A1
LAAAFEEGILETIIFLPGGGGSCLTLNGVSVWPPTPLEFVTHYSRLQQFLDPGLVATQILSSIPPNALVSWPVYGPILEALQAMAAASNLKLIPFPYDFRKSVFDSAAGLQAAIVNCYNTGDVPVTLVCHSTGNQVGRAVLENKQLQAQPWFSCLKRYIGICGPHFGVPEVLEYGLGLSDWLSIAAADMKTFSQDHRYPGCYQLFPYLNYPGLADEKAGQLNFYNPAVATAFGLDTTNLGAALSLQATVQFSNKPPNVEYDLVAAFGQMTDELIEYNGAAFAGIEPKDDGDDTVPLWSAHPAGFNVKKIKGDHMGVLNTYELQNYLHQLLTGAAAPLVLEAIARVALSLDRRVYAPGDKMFVLVIPDQPTGQIAGALTTEKLADDGSAFQPYATLNLAYSGPVVRSIRGEVAAPAQPGFYRMSFTGATHSTAPQGVAGFAVSQTSRRARRR